jgi:plastocyanin
MRRLLLAAVLALGVLAAPAHAANVKISNFSFMPASITIGQGESVTWTWAGPDTNHSVTSGANQADSWDSDPGKTPSSIDHLPGSTFSHTFNTPGTFTYLCKVHSFMTGKVVVKAPGGPDTTAPALSKVSTTAGRKCKKGAKKCKGRPTTLRFKLSEAATVKVKVPKHKAANVTRVGKAGLNTINFSTSMLPPGKWTLNVTATDAAGNTSPVKPVKVTVKNG